MARISGSRANSSTGLFGSFFGFSWAVATNGEKREKTPAKQILEHTEDRGLRGIELSHAPFIFPGLSQLLYKISLFSLPLGLNLCFLSDCVTSPKQTLSCSAIMV